jgi:hypothetical protein
MTDLSEEQRSRILLEERYRDEVRRQLSADANARHGRVVKFFNTHLGLWLLSAIFISGLGTVYRYYENDREYRRGLEDKRFEEQQLRLEKALEAKAARDSEVARLDREISYRLSRTLTKLRDIAVLFRIHESGKTGKALEATSTEHQRQADQAVEQLLLAPQDPRNLLYVGHKEKSVASLLLELAGVAESSAERLAIQAAHQKLVARAESPVRLMAFGAPHARNEAAWLQEECILPRWRKQGFVLTTCTPQAPFCGPKVTVSSTSTVTVR